MLIIIIIIIIGKVKPNYKNVFNYTRWKTRDFMGIKHPQIQRVKHPATDILKTKISITQTLYALIPNSLNNVKLIAYLEK